MKATARRTLALKKKKRDVSHKLFLTAIVVILLVEAGVGIAVKNAMSATLASSVNSLPPKPVLAFWYGWYWEGAWLDGRNGSDTMSVAYVPTLGFYNSQNLSVIDEQISQAKSSGVNGFIASWWGPNSTADKSDKLLFQEVSKLGGFSATLYFETSMIYNMKANLNVEQNQIMSDINYIMATYGNSPAFTRYDNKPIIYFFGTSSWSPQFWENITSTVRSSYRNLLLIGDSLDPSYLPAFDGLANYVNLYFVTHPNSVVNGTYPSYLKISNLAKSSGKLWFAPVSPGFDNINDPRENFSYVPRNNGSTYATSWQIAENSDPNGILVSTWNEFYEGTAIEPTTSFGSYYEQLTLQLATTWRLSV